MEFRGEETNTLELLGSIPASEARSRVPSRLALEETAGRAVVGLLLFQMRRLRLRGTPGPSFDYSEALWRIGIVTEGQPAWFAVACDLDHPAVRALGRLLIRNPTRAAAVTWETGEATSVRVQGASAALRICARPSGGELAPAAPRRAFVGSTAVYEVPWREDPAPWRRSATLEVLDDSLAASTLGSVRWEPTGLLHRGRIHRCGLARRLGRAASP